MSATRERRIRDRAYAIWQAEGCPDGRHVAHWRRAEAEIDEEARIIVMDDGKKIKSVDVRTPKPQGG